MLFDHTDTEMKNKNKKKNTNFFSLILGVGSPDSRLIHKRPFSRCGFVSAKRQKKKTKKMEIKNK
jgi:hypothetical protein